MNTENQNIEFKKVWKDEYLKWICAFANTDGGTLYIGVNDNGEVCGIDNFHRLTEDIPNKIRHTMGLVCSVNLLTEGDKKYFEIISVFTLSSLCNQVNLANFGVYIDRLSLSIYIFSVLI